MTTNRITTPIHYVHNQPESFASRMIKLALRVIGLKNKLEKDMVSGKINQQPASLPKSLTENFDVDTDTRHGRPVWIVKPRATVSEQVVLLLHGGAYIYNMSSVHWQLVELLLIQTGATIVIPDYPLAPHSTALEAYAFVESVYNQLLETTSPQHISLMGDSAGAGLALGLAQSLRDAGNPLPQQLILLAPFLDITMGNPGIAAVEKQDVILTVKGLQLAGAAYAGTLDHKDYRVSPIYGTFQGLPPMSIFIGTHDLFIADVRDFTQQLKSQNIAFNYFEYPNMVHDHIVLVNLPEAKHAITQIADLMR